MEKEALIRELKDISRNNYAIEDKKRLSLYLNFMLDNIGDPDPDLRDELIYFIFNNWILEKEYFENRELADIMDVLLDDRHLFFNLGNQCDNSVLTRSFSILVIVLILIRHRKKSIFAIDEFVTIKNKLLAYYSGEKDLRGYDDVCGWAHAAAHGADAMDELVLCIETGEAVCLEILYSIKNVLYNGLWLFSNEEDERIARVVYRMIKSGKLPRNSMSEWLESLTECCSWEQSRIKYINRVNTKNFIRSLYFKILHNKTGLDFGDTLLAVEQRLNRFFGIDKGI